jgi:hypothetical protein
LGPIFMVGSAPLVAISADLARCGQMAEPEPALAHH